MKLERCMELYSSANDTIQNVTLFEQEYIKSYRKCLYDYDIKTSETTGMTVMLTILSLMGVVGNILLIMVYMRQQTKPTTTYFIIALGIHDLLLSGVLIPYQTIISYVLIPPGTMWFCGIIEWFNDTLLITSVFFLVEIAIDRYYAVCKPLKFAITPYRAKIIITVTLIACALQGIPSSISEGGFIETSFQNSSLYIYVGDYKEGTDLRYIKPIGKMVMDRYFFLLFIFLSVTIIVCYVNVFVVICRRAKKKQANRRGGISGSPSNSTDSTELSAVSNNRKSSSSSSRAPSKLITDKISSREQRNAIKLAYVLLTVTIVFIVVWLPYFGIRLGLVRDHKALSVTYFLSNALNPVLYCFTNPCFRKELRKMLHCRK